MQAGPDSQLLPDTTYYSACVRTFPPAARLFLPSYFHFLPARLDPDCFSGWCQLDPTFPTALCTNELVINEKKGALGIEGLHTLIYQIFLECLLFARHSLYVWVTKVNNST